ncbi:helix-turn-helix domain-containing protein [Streptomyces sp. MH13]|uniref:helix-turn-helix domain-containing protein n=1 Tax=Streptomyces sp. MH13 TaxID=3417651 RepID=UPI003CF5FD39
MPPIDQPDPKLAFVRRRPSAGGARGAATVRVVAVGKRWHLQVFNAPPTDDHVIVEAQVRDYGFSPAQQDEVRRRWHEGQSFSLIGRALGAPMQSARRFLHQSGGVRITPQQRSERHLSGSEREEISRGIAAGESGRQLAGRLGRSPSTVLPRDRPQRRPGPLTSAGAVASRPSWPNNRLCAPWWRRSWLCAGLPIRSQGGCYVSSLATPSCRSRTSWYSRRNLRRSRSRSRRHPGR